jgi:hypothetical protein
MKRVVSDMVAMLPSIPCNFKELGSEHSGPASTRVSFAKSSEICLLGFSPKTAKPAQEEVVPSNLMLQA